MNRTIGFVIIMYVHHLIIIYMLDVFNMLISLLVHHLVLHFAFIIYYVPTVHLPHAPTFCVVDFIYFTVTFVARCTMTLA